MSEEEVVKITLLTFEANFVTLDEDPVLQVMFIVGSMAQSGETLITTDNFSVETRLWP